MKPTDCHKFNKCSAAICPLEPSIGTHLQGERVCLAATELAKEDGQAVVAGAFGPEIASQVNQALTQLRSKYGDIDRRVKAASTSGSKIAGGARVQKSLRPRQ